jgi:protein-disulfide isomerase
LRLPNLAGQAVDLASLRGFRTLVLFWSPSCGYCQDILEDVKKWERNRPAGAPELVIISSGPAEEIRNQGFSSTVLLDQDNVGKILGAEGTPSAVIINEQGIVASDVRVGADQVFDLALGKI